MNWLDVITLLFRIRDFLTPEQKTDICELLKDLQEKAKGGNPLDDALIMMVRLFLGCPLS